MNPILLLLAAALGGWPHQESETAQQTFQFPSDAGPVALEVDNVEGSIEVSGGKGREARLVVRETRRARSPERLAAARQEVRLDVSRDGNRVRLYVDGPFRCRDDSRGRQRPGYEVRFDFVLAVPEGASLTLKTVNGGEIRVDQVAGALDLENVNGGIEVRGGAGPGRAYAVNGGVSVSYRQVPAGPSYFGSLNGDVNVQFPPELSANLLVKTFNGELYSDFEVSYLPAAPDPPERKAGKLVYRSNRFAGLRVGRGGPEIRLDTFNGNIHILKRGQNSHEN